MIVCFYRTYPKIDGSLTYKMRLAKALGKKGHQTYFLFSCAIDLQMQNELLLVAPVYFTGDLPQNKIPSPNVIYAGADGDYIAKVFDIKRNYFPKAAVVFGAWASDSFIHSSKIGWSPDGALYKKFLRSLPASNITFMGPTIKEKHEKFAGRAFSNNTIVPNSLELSEQLPVGRKFERKKIVSLGRLEPSKEYLFSVIELLPKFPNLEFHIYGSGSFEQPLKLLAEKCGVEKRVFLYGVVPYSQVMVKISDAAYFIGMGIAIVEAASMGIPSIQAIEYTREPIVYGWFHNMTDGEVGEYRRGKATMPLEELFEEIVKLTNEDYAIFCKKSFDRAQDYNISNVINKFEAFLEGANNHFDFKVSKVQRILLKFLRQPFKLLKQNRKKRIGK